MVRCHSVASKEISHRHLKISNTAMPTLARDSSRSQVVHQPVNDILYPLRRSNCSPLSSDQPPTHIAIARIRTCLAANASNSRSRISHTGANPTSVASVSGPTAYVRGLSASMYNTSSAPELERALGLGTTFFCTRPSSVEAPQHPPRNLHGRSGTAPAPSAPGFQSAECTHGQSM